MLSDNCDYHLTQAQYAFCFYARRTRGSSG